MMETVLNIGLNDASVKGLAEESGDERFAWDSYRRLLQMFGKTVLGIPGEVFSDALDRAKSAKGVASDVDLDVDDPVALVAVFKGRGAGALRSGVPAAPAGAAGPGDQRRLPTPGTPTGLGCTGAASDPAGSGVRR